MGWPRLLRPMSHPLDRIRPMQATSLKFAGTVRTLGQAARLRGLIVPSFRCPPSIEGVHRTIRHRGGVPTVAVRLRGRPWPAVVSDMIEGIVVGNGLSGARADRIRAALWLAIDNPSGSREVASEAHSPTECVVAL